MRDKPEKQPSPGTPAVELELLADGFHFEDGRWIDQVRRAESAIHMGSIGDYELQAEIGRGAQGVVYKALQPHTRRRIAIKRLAGGSLAGADNSARLRREVEAAAALDHPAIVTVYGMDLIDGQPVLAMEWIDGEPVDSWSDRIGRDRQRIKEQLGLFLQICAGIEHAHERGVIHRDIKPTNILVNGQGTPRILDFGLAKFNTDGGAESDLTVTGGFIGTPAYAAPEKLAGIRGISEIRSDVYSLGVLLYRMLTGRLPHKLDVPFADFADPSRWIDPERASGINPALNTELDAILLTALAIEPQRRYASVDKLIDDIRRHLEGLPISAGPSSLTYRVRRTLRRHKAVFATVAVIALTLVAATIVSSVLAVQAARARAQAHERTRAAQAINEFLTEDLLAAVDPANTDNPDLTMRQVLDRAAVNIQGRFAEEPLVKASILHTIGRSYLGLGLPNESIPHFQGAAELRNSRLGALDADTRLAERDLAHALCSGERSEEAMVVAGALLPRDIQETGADSQDTMATRYVLVRCKDNFDLDEKLAELNEILDWNMEHLGPAHPQTLDVTHELANEYLYNQRAEKAEPIVVRMYQAVRETYGESHPQTMDAMLGLAVLYGRTERVEEAVQILQESVRIYRETRPKNFYPMGITLGHLGAHLRVLKRYDEAEAAFIEGHEILAASRGPEIGWAQGIVRMLAGMYGDMGEHEKAAMWRERLLPEHEKPIPVRPPSE